METHSLFVYGTLIHPHILARVLTGRLGASVPPSDAESRLARLSVVPALVTGHELRRVRGQEYPGLVAGASAGAPAPAPAPVRGVVVHGLTYRDLLALDDFEGDEYVRGSISAIVPASEQPVGNDVRAGWSADAIGDVLDTSLPTHRVQALLAGTEPSNTLQVQGYTWVAGVDRLEEDTGPRGPWLFSTFARSSKSSKWTSGPWADAGGPDGIADEQRSPATPIPGTGSSLHGGFDEVRRTLATDGSTGKSHDDASASTSASASAFSGMNLAAGQDPWADPPTSALISPAASVEKSDNPWAISSTTGGDGVQNETHATQSTLRREEIPPGFPLELQGVEMPGYERFGKPVSRLWLHGVQPGKDTRRYLAFNNGGGGSCPKPVLEAYRKWAEKADENADIFYRRTVLKEMRSLRTRLAAFVKCPTNTLAVVTNATTGTNAVMQSFPWEAGDCVLVFSTLYGAVRKCLQYRQDMLPDRQPEIIELDVYLPITNDALVDLFRSKIRALKAEGKRVRMASFDAICSGPGVLVPWERLVAVCKDEGVLSFVDAAHAFGQIPIDLTAAQPDFFVANAHKWGYAHRTAALFHVPLRNQHYVHSGVPTGWNFRSRADRAAQPPLEEGDDFIKQWEEVGTVDWGSMLSIGAALDFREQRLGGEERIRAYTHSLALLGGLAVARTLGTDVLETMQPASASASASAPGSQAGTGTGTGALTPTHTASMVNVRLPLASRAIGTDVDAWLWSRRGEAYVWDTLMDEFGVAVRLAAVIPPPPPPGEGGAADRAGSSAGAAGRAGPGDGVKPPKLVYARISAQVWLDLSDFEYLGRALKEVCRRVNAGEADASGAILPEGQGRRAAG